MEFIISRLCGRLLCRRWMWRFDLVNDGNRIQRLDLLIVTCNYVGGRLLLLRMSDGIGTARSRF